MDVSFEQVINDHLELKKRNAALRAGQDVEDGSNRPGDDDELQTRENAKGELPPEGDGDLWAGARDFEWGE